jgi:IS605 OrfB family transposase
MFKTARFKVHNPSRHKSTMLWYAMTRYHETLKDVLEKTLALPNLTEQVSELDKKGKLRPNKFRLSKVLYTIAPQDWELAPLRDYLIGDASAMLMSHLSKAYKGENDSNPPTVSSLDAMTEEEFREAYRKFTDPETKLAIRPQHQEKIDKAKERGETRVAERLSKIYANWAVSRAAGQVLRKLEGALPHPIEFTRNEFGRGCLLAFCDGNYYLLVRLFAQGHRYCEKRVLKDGFIDCKTKARIGVKKYPGMILPLELGREFHEREYLTYGAIQSAKLVVKRREKPTSGARAHVNLAGGDASAKRPVPFKAEDCDFYVHAAFEFLPPQIETETFLGIDRGAAKIGAATLIDRQGKPIQADLDLDGAAFAAEMRRFEELIKRLQQSGKQRSRKFSLRGKRGDIILGEYANRIVAIAKQNRSQIVIEAIKGVTMGRFLKQSQFTKLKQMLTYKAEREGLPAPVEVPAAYTSQTCAKCGHKDAANRPKKDAAGKAIQDVFLCVACGHSANADSNASQIIALRGLHQLENGGKFKKFDLFQQWLKELIGRDGSPALGQQNQ